MRLAIAVALSRIRGPGPQVVFRSGPEDAPRRDEGARGPKVVDVHFRGTFVAPLDREEATQKLHATGVRPAAAC